MPAWLVNPRTGTVAVDRPVIKVVAHRWSYLRPGDGPGEHWYHCRYCRTEQVGTDGVEPYQWGCTAS